MNLSDEARTEAVEEAVLPAPGSSRNLARGAWFFLLLALANLMWAGQGPASVILGKKIQPIALTFLPFYVATLLLVPVLLWERKRHPGATWPTKRDWTQFAIAGVCGQIAAQWGATQGSISSSASNYSILNLLVPVITAVLATFMLRERMTPLRLLCLAIGLVGVFLLSKSDLQQASFISKKYLVGNLICLISCLGSAFYNVYCKDLLHRFRQTEILIYSYITASIVSVPFLIWVEPFHFATLKTLDRSDWLWFAFLAIFMYGVSMILFFYVLRHLTVTVASFSLYLVPIFGVGLSVYFAGEHISSWQIYGSAVVLAATLLIIKFDTLET